MGANIAPWLVCPLVVFLWILEFIREGVAVMCIGGASSSLGEVFLRFRETLLSRESESEAWWEDSESGALFDSVDEPDASSDTCELVAGPWRVFCAAIVIMFELRVRFS